MIFRFSAAPLGLLAVLLIAPGALPRADTGLARWAEEQRMSFWFTAWSSCLVCIAENFILLKNDDKLEAYPTMKSALRKHPAGEGRNAMRICLIAILLSSCSVAAAKDVLVEAESFTDTGGWNLDTQFIREMGSPYMLAHGLGSPVADATTTVEFAETGIYHVFVRTKDWVARGKAEGQPGRFQVLVDGQPLTETFGTTGVEWDWQSGGTLEIAQKSVTLSLHDLTGFDGRCDAIFFTKSDALPPNDKQPLSDWRREQLGLKAEPTKRDGYDLVVVGGGYSGMGAAISAARMGCKVALIQDRPVLGGNGSSEVRVWAMGNIRRGRFPRIGEIIEEFADHATKSPGRAEEFGDDLKEAVVKAEKNIDLFLNHHAYAVKTDKKHIVSVTAFGSERDSMAACVWSDISHHSCVPDTDHHRPQRVLFSSVSARCRAATGTTTHFVAGKIVCDSQTMAESDSPADRRMGCRHRNAASVVQCRRYRTVRRLAVEHCGDGDNYYRGPWTPRILLHSHGILSLRLSNRRSVDLCESLKWQVTESPRSFGGNACGSVGCRFVLAPIRNVGRVQFVIVNFVTDLKSALVSERMPLDARRYRCHCRCAGRLIVKRVPLPGSLSHTMCPWWASTMRRTVGRPRPLPPERVEKNA